MTDDRRLGWRSELVREAGRAVLDVAIVDVGAAPRVGCPYARDEADSAVVLASVRAALAQIPGSHSPRTASLNAPNPP